MAEAKKQHRWPLSLGIIAIVVIVSVALGLSYHGAPGNIPVRAVRDDSGVIVAWGNGKGIYAQRLNLSGEPQWGKGGLLVCEGSSLGNFNLTHDGLGGVIITWDDRSGMPDDHTDPAFFDPVPFHAQRVDADGQLLWSDSLISSGGSWQVVPDGEGGASFAWNEFKPYFRALHDDYLRLQRLAPDGRRLWGSEGALIVASSPFRPVTPEDAASGIKGTITRSRPTYEGQHYIVADGAGGVFVLWAADTGAGVDTVYAQRVDSAGKYVWPDKVVTGAMQLASAESDGAGRVIIGTGGTATGDMYLDGDGKMLPPPHWALLQQQQVIFSDWSRRLVVLDGGFLVRFEEDPLSVSPMNRRTIVYLQKLDEAGKGVWPEKRVVNPPEKTQLRGIDYLSDGSGGIIITWQLQKESVALGSIMAQRFDAGGSLVWGEEGIPVFAPPGIRYQSKVASFEDGSGGIIVVAAAGKNALGGDMVYAQRLNAGGERVWGDGVRLDR